jgi:type I restriction enzyme R subunit
MPFNEADTRAKLIDPTIHKVGWNEDLIRRETTAGTIEIINGRPKRRVGRTDYFLCLPISKEGQIPLAIAILEAKKESEHATIGLEQAKQYAKGYTHRLFSLQTVTCLLGMMTSQRK